ncbi:MAG: 4Fe-4S ferredoxin, iron-sulfur binding domain protein [Gammaproteobacteria bacterium]|jgi:ferredoxin|nr:4Fe-4S ferredoxin, iron-sulfur binding domain protein [Gammaproteobacteria bacterium]
MLEVVKFMQYFLPHTSITDLLIKLHAQGYRCIGPQVQDSCIMYDTITEAKQLPWGTADQQSAGFYQLTESNSQRAFNWANSPSSIKPFLFKQQDTVWRVQRNTEGKISFQPVVEYESLALFGIRPCDLAAMIIQDKVFLESGAVDPRYEARRKALFLIVVNCNAPSANCFCISAGQDVEAKAHFDLAMTEIDSGFVVTGGSEKAAKLIQELKLESASETHKSQAHNQLTQARNLQSKKLPEKKLAQQEDLLNHPHWQEVAQRCFGCGTCTQVCPTCFCHKQSVQTTSDGYEQVREWDSCFSEKHSYVNGAPLRKDVKSRYQQWLCHKMLYWEQQFSCEGCVGCGRCITWCPAQIDVTEELSKLVEK